MTSPNLELWAQSHMRWLALSRWDTEGGASPLRPTSGCASALLLEGSASPAGPAKPTNPESAVPGPSTFGSRPP
jgi:hypothetical protein